LLGRRARLLKPLENGFLFGKLGAKLGAIRNAVEHETKHRLIRKRLDLLWKKADPYAWNGSHDSRIGFDVAREEPKQARLAGAVRPDEPDVIALVHLQREPFEQLLSTQC